METRVRRRKERERGGDVRRFNQRGTLSTSDRGGKCEPSWRLGYSWARDMKNDVWRRHTGWVTRRAQSRYTLGERFLRVVRWGDQHARQIFSPVFVLGRPRKSKSVLVVGEEEDVSREDSRIPTIEIDLSFLLFIPSLWLLPLSCVLANSHVTEIVTDPASTSVVDRGGFGNGWTDRNFG